MTRDSLPVIRNQRRNPPSVKMNSAIHRSVRKVGNVIDVFFFITGTCKIARNCTSTLVVTYVDDGAITVDVRYTHYGHEKELQHIRLAKEKRQEVAAKIQQGVPRDRVLSDIRESVTEDNLSREHLLKNEDLTNMTSVWP